MDLLNKRMDYFILLIDVIAGGLCSPMHQTIYDKLRRLSPEEALKVTKNKYEFLREITTEGYAKSRKLLKEIKDKTDDPIKKEEYEAALAELDGIFNLLDSIGNESSPEHVRKIMDNVLMSIDKMRQKGIDINIEGLSPFESI
jgi:hypothetical protein